MSETRVIVAKAPSNIALIKYMGKSDAKTNTPMNPSLSMTLNHFATYAELSRVEYHSGAQTGMRWITEPPQHQAPEKGLPWVQNAWSESAIARVERFAARIGQELPAVFQEFGFTFRPLTGFELRTANTFPPSAGLASSASAFAAVTLAFASAQCGEPEKFRERFDTDLALRAALAKISKLGSGSSCRSLLGPWVMWKGNEVVSVNARVPQYADLVLLFKAAPKAVSSSEAHQRVLSSSAWSERPARATQRCEQLVQALETGDTDTVARLSWQDSWDMHHLFHTATPAFSYWEAETFAALKWLMDSSPAELPKPIVTLDAGPNIHLLIPEEFTSQWKARLFETFPETKVLQDEQGKGAELIRE